MYKILVDGTLFSDSRIDDLAIINPIVNVGVNVAGSCSFVIPPRHPKYDMITRRTSIISIYRDDDAEPIFQGICTSESVDFFKQKTITCEGELSYLNDSILRPARYEGYNPVTLLTSYINQHNEQVDEWKRFEVGHVTVTDPNNYISCYTNMNPTMQEIKEDLVDDLGGYIRLRYDKGHKYIDYLAEATRIASQPIELGKNLIDYSSNLDSTKIATIVIPLGVLEDEGSVENLQTRLTISSVNDGKDFLIDQSAVDAYGMITKTVVFDEVTTPEMLKAKGQHYLSDIQFENTYIEVKAVDMGYLIKDMPKWNLLDSVHIVSEAHGMDRWFPLTKMQLDLQHPERDVFTFGNNIRTSIASQVANTTSSIVKQISNMPDTSAMAQAIAQATALITGTKGGYIKFNYNDDGQPYEMLVMDTDSVETAVNVWRFNQGGIGHSSNGYAGPYDTAITMNGHVTADVVESNSGNIAGWKITSNGIYKDVAVPNSTTVYRVYLQPPTASSLDKTWILSCQKSTDSGKNFGGQFVLYADGSAKFGNAIINADGSARFGQTTSNYCFQIASDGRMSVRGTNGYNGSIDIGSHTLYFANGLCTNIS